MTRWRDEAQVSQQTAKPHRVTARLREIQSCNEPPASLLTSAMMAVIWGTDLSA
jgi:hypothetical protein